jgi:hypothetical protein
MIDVEPLIRDELERFYPLPSGARADWADVVARADLSRGWRSHRRLALAFATTLAVLASAVAVAATLGGFDDWLRGQPGEPASEQAQRRFEQASGRSWASFPVGTELRELIRTRVGTHEYVLYGFRSGTSLCLKLAASEFARQPQACAPASTLAALSAPILVVVTDHPFHDRANRPVAQTSFGIVADGVSRIDVHAIGGRHRARIGGNAYLFVAPEPNTTERVLRLTAYGPRGRRTDVPITRSRFGTFARPGEAAPGPTKLEATIRDPRIRWHERGEPRGFTIEQVKLTPAQRHWLAQAGTQGWLRLVKPDPLSDFVVGLSGAWCLVTVHSMGCSPRESFFSRGPLNVMINGTASTEFAWVLGAAADGVARVELFLTNGQRLRVPMRHNLFAALAPTAGFPFRIVGYDARDRVVAIQTPPFFGRERIPAQARRLRMAREIVGPNGTRAALHLGPRVRGYECWRAVFGTGQTRSGCRPPVGGGPKIEVDLVQQAGNDIFVVGRVAGHVARVDFELPLRQRVAMTRPIDGHFLLAVPAPYLGPVRRHAYVVGFDRSGHRVQRQGVYYRVR